MQQYSVALPHNLFTPACNRVTLAATIIFHNFYQMNKPLIHYTLAAATPQNHLFEITLSIPCPDPAGQILRLPAWIPGSYLVRDFARHIVDIRAESAGKKVRLEKIDKSAWRTEKVRGPLTVFYRVYAYDLSVRGAYLDQTRGFFNGTSVFLAVEGQEDQPCRVTLNKPEGEAFAAWQVATGLTALHAKANVFGDYLADNYGALIDHPVEMGCFAHYTFDACGVPHEVVIAGRHGVDHARLLRDMQKICTYQIELFGEPAPFNRYVFLVMATGSEYGGLEHRNSTALICSRDDLPQPGQDEVSAGYRRLLGLVSHEYFHSWNVKRLKPQVFAPYDLTQENYTRLLWAFEGITSYYDDLTLVRTGLISAETYLCELGKAWSAVLRNPGTEIQTLEEASFDAWIKYYRQDENSPNSLVSYYTKGAMVALLLDATIREASAGKFSLDDVMRALWQRYGKTFATLGEGVPENAWEVMAQEITGVDLRGFFNRALRQTRALPVKKILAYLGVDYQERAAQHSQDLGGEWHDHPKPAPQGLGIRFKVEPASARVTHVLAHSPAESAGIAAGDVLIALDDLRIDGDTLEQRLAELPAGQAIRLHLFRRDELMVLNVQLAAYQRPVCALRMKKQIKGTHAARWLNRKQGTVLF